MNKKALTVQQLILALVAVFIIAVVFYFLFGPGKETLFKPDTLIPNLNATKPPAQDIEILGFEIEEHKAQFFDGISWLDFNSQEVELNNKKITYDTALADFTTDYYYNRNFPVKLDLKNRINDNIKSIPRWKNGRLYDKEFSIIAFDEAFTRGGVLILANVLGDLDKPEESFVKKYFILTIRDELLEDEQDDSGVIAGYSKATHIDSPEREIREKVSEWRDSIFEQPITIHYKEEGIEKTDLFCVEKAGARLVVNLAEPKTKCTA